MCDPFQSALLIHFIDIYKFEVNIIREERVQYNVLKIASYIIYASVSIDVSLSVGFLRRCENDIQGREGEIERERIAKQN